jgi:AcrR family transcriptional regulator
MPRPSRRIDEALLASGRALYPDTGGAGLSLRLLAEHAGANLGMFHYHFRTKDNFLRTLLQQMYEQLYAALQAEATMPGAAALPRLRGALIAAGRVARANRRMLGRVWTEAMAGDPVAVDFLRRNAPRHLGLLLELMQSAEREGAIIALPPLQRFAFLMGAVALPNVFAGGLIEVVFDARTLKQQFEPQVLADEAIAGRVDLALAALAVAAKRRRGRSDA